MGNPRERARPGPTRTLLVRELLPLVLLVCACGAAVRAGEPAGGAGAGSDPASAGGEARAAGAASAGGVATESPEAAAAFEALAARAAALAPGMHEAARKESGGDVVDLVKADARDTCVRVAYEATAPVTASLVDRGGEVLAKSDAAATEGALGAKGPVCVRKGDVVRASADGAGSDGGTDASGGGGMRVRWIAWETR
jgi:hypothetical protein